MKILIAEDEAVSRRILESRLKQWGHEVIAAKDGAEAWELFQQGDFPVVITDWMMPNMDGLELIKNIRAAEETGYAYTILLTAKSQKEELVEGMEAGADDFVRKPFDKEELRARLRAGERIITLEKDLAQQNEVLEAANKEIAAANRQMKRDLQAAAQIQRALLPSSLPEDPRVSFAWNFKPCAELGGDILNVFRLDEKHFGIYILDVSGHGVAAAMLSVTLSRVLTPLPDQSSVIKQHMENPPRYRLAPPVEVAEQLNKRFQMDTDTGQYFTILYGLLNIETLEFRYTSAGHPEIIHAPAGEEPRLVESRGLPIGFTEEPGYEEQVVKLNPGDRLYFYSDGLTEAANDSHEQFGPVRTMETVEELRDLELETGLDALLKQVESWSGSAVLEDDFSLLALELTPLAEPIHAHHDILEEARAG